MSTVKKGQILEGTVSVAAYEGKGIARLDGFPIFLKNVAIGDKVRFRVGKKRKGYAEGHLLNILEPSEIRIQPKCKHAFDCGGCQWQHVGYDEQLRFKQEHVTDHIHRIGNLREVTVEPVIECEQHFFYRNKMEFSFGDRRWLTNDEIAQTETLEKAAALGLHAPGRFDRILNVDKCWLQGDVSQEVLTYFHSVVDRGELTCYNPKEHRGLLRNLIVRSAQNGSEWLIALVYNGNEGEIPKELIADFRDKFSDKVRSFVIINNDTRSPSHDKSEQKLVWGPGFLTEIVDGIRFEVFPTAFFQTNTAQAEKLFKKAIDLANIVPSDIVFDLYCGVGTIALMAAKNALEVCGIELNPESIKNATKNAVDNGISNVRFVQGDMKDSFAAALKSSARKPNVVITDPPRAGMHPDVVTELLQLAPERIVYVSCNSATLSRDLALLSQKYEIGTVQPVDMFPQTYHIETVAQLTLKVELE